MKRIITILVVLVLLTPVLPVAAHHDSEQQDYVIETESQSENHDTQADHGKSVQRKRCCNKDEN